LSLVPAAHLTKCAPDCGANRWRGIMSQINRKEHKT
jgi:hypothetical protein